MTRAASTLVLVMMGAGCGVWRDAEYRALLDGFGSATSQSVIAEGSFTPQWRFDVPLQTSHAVASVEGRQGLDVIRVHYSDEATARTLYQYVDYSTPSDVRVQSGVLYVRWSESLLWSTSYVLAFDLEERRLRTHRRVDPQDLTGK